MPSALYARRRAAGRMSTWLPTRRPGLRVTIGIVVALACAIGGAWYWIVSGRSASTENAYVNARVVQVSSLVMGQVVEVPVRENSVVRAGDVLFVVDRRPFENALAEAEGRLRLAEQGTRADTSEVAAAAADVQQQQASLANAEANLRRTQQLVAQGFMSRQAQDDAVARVNVARAAVAAADARLAKARAAVATTGDVTPAVRIAQAEVEKARLDLEHTVVRASEPGTVTHFDLVAGTVVTPGTPLFALVVAQSFWVDANFKETELGGVRPGLPATIEVDLYPKHPFHGHVESLAGGTGAAFSLLPPQNATGNWVKVAQRVPVRITVDDPDPAFPLRVGATATVTVDLRAAAASPPTPAAATGATGATGPTGATAAPATATTTATAVTPATAAPTAPAAPARPAAHP
jgi:membrane fusion protein (multidrug efflux system)